MLTAGAIAAFAIVGALVLAHYTKYSKAQIILMIAGGAGVGGAIGTLLTRVGHGISHSTATGAAKVFGAGVPAILAVVVVGILFFELEPGNKSPAPWAKWVGLLLFPILIITGGSWAQIGAHGQGWVQSAGNGLISIGTSLAQGWG